MSIPLQSKLQALRNELCGPDMDQGHLFIGWPDSVDLCNEKQLQLLRDLYTFSDNYHGGIVSYIRNGRALLARERDVVDLKLLQMPPLIFHAPSLQCRTSELVALESAGTVMLRKTVFVLVAGGLGERLGSRRIKISLPVETATNTSYLAYYVDWARRVGGRDVPFVIMTSDDTHEETVQLLRVLHVEMPNLRLLKQSQVFCFTDSAAHLAVDAEGRLLRKPHGHGDIHSLIYHATATTTRSSDVRNGTASSLPLIDAWLAAGYESIVFIQDTNAGAVATLPVSLALSAEHALDLNFTCIPRLPRESIGLLCQFTKNDGGPWVVANVEYNVLSEVSHTLNPEGGGGASSATGVSAFPGSINTLVFKLSTYADRLRASHGTVPEFINPKYTDDTRRAFKKPARIESLMQDIALLFREDAHRVGGTVFERFSYQPVKNSLDGAAVQVAQGNNAYCPASAEADFYELQRRRLRAIGVPVPSPSQPDVIVANGSVPVRLFPIIVLDSICAASGSLEDLAQVFPTPEKLCIHQRSALIVKGRVIIESLQLCGALIIHGPKDPAASPYVVRDAVVHNAGWSVQPITSLSPSSHCRLSEADHIRGFVLDKSIFDVMEYNAGGGVSFTAPSCSADPAKL